jgi:hypothetical protein
MGGDDVKPQIIFQCINFILFSTCLWEDENIFFIWLLGSLFFLQKFAMMKV